MSERPLPIVVIAAYYFFVGLLSLFAGVFGSLVGTLAICFGPGMLAQGVWGIVTGVLNLILGGAVWSGKDWAKTIVSLLAIIGIVVGVLSGSWMSAIVNAAVLLYMQSDAAKRFFVSR